MRIAFFGLAALTALCSFYAEPVNALSYPVLDEMKTRPVRREQTSLPGIIAIDGGVPIKVGNDVIGGVGASGSPGVDEECVNAGLEKVKRFLQ